MTRKRHQCHFTVISVSKFVQPLLTLLLNFFADWFAVNFQTVIKNVNTIRSIKKRDPQRKP